MREIFEDIFVTQPLDPRESARRNMRPNLPKRFYTEASVGEEGEGGFVVLLDGKPVRTPARRPLAAPTRALAQKLAEEWHAQAELIDPARMPLTRLANAVTDKPAPVADEVARYLGSDLVFYRAEMPEGLVARQAELWDPLLAFARDEFGARFVQIAGIIHSAQPPHAIDAARAHIPADAWRLAAVSSITTLTGSALLALMLARGAITADAAWEAAHLDEDWQMAQWGRDELALARRAFRRTDFDAAATVLALTA